MLSKISIFKQTVKYLALGILSALIIIACSNPNNDSVKDRGAIAPNLQPTNCRIAQHALGETEVCGKTQKIVALSPHILDLLLSLDRQPAGYADVIDIHQGEMFDNPTQQIPYLGDRITTKPVNLGTSNKPSLEKLTALKPDLIIGEASRNESSYDLLTQIAPTLLFDSRAAPGQWQQSIKTMAQALGDEQLAQSAIDSHEQLVANAKAELAPVVSKHPQLLLLATNKPSENMWAVGHQTYLGTMMRGIGFQLIAGNSEDNNEPNFPVPLETLPQFNDADIILLLGYDLDPTSQQQLEENGDIESQQLKAVRQNWRSNAIAQAMPATQGDRVYFAPAYLWLGFNGSIGTELIIEQLRQRLL